jgi:two-component system sensor histidine kinase HydH
MSRHHQPRRPAGMRTSPWIILGSTAILLIVVIIFTVQHTNRENRYMTKILSAKGAALIRAVEAGTRTGMMGMMWGGQQIQRLLEEIGRLPDVRYMAVVDKNGIVLAHSDPSRIGKPFSKVRKLIHLGPDLEENHELVDLGAAGRVFEVHRHFRPFLSGGMANGRMQAMMDRNERMHSSSDDWFSPGRREQLLIVVGLRVAPFKKEIRQDIRTTIILSAVLLLAGFGGFVSLFWMNNYRQTKRSLQDTSAFADEVVTHLPVGLIATDRTGRVTFFNAAAEKITGLPMTSALGQHPDKLFPPQLCGLEQALDRGEIISEKEMECTFSGRRFVPLSVSATAIFNEVGEFVGRVLILRDLREVRRLQKEVRRQEKLAALGGLAAGVAHEIRNPLSSIKGMATFFGAQFADGSEGKEAAGVMIEEVNRLNRAISELLDFARPADLKRKRTEIAPLIMRSIQLIQQDAKSRNIQVDLKIGEDLGVVNIDPDRMSQCLLNLYLNAIDAMKDGGTLCVQCEADGDQALSIAVTDTGPGIAADQLDKIFDPYFTTKNKGTGLGLAIVYKIIEAHGGRINVESAAGRGTTMTIRIPGDTGTGS